MNGRIMGAVGIATLAFAVGFAAAPATLDRDRAVVELSHLSSALQLLDFEQKGFDELMLQAASGEDKARAEDARLNALGLSNTRGKLRARMLNLCRQYGGVE